MSSTPNSSRAPAGGAGSVQRAMQVFLGLAVLVLVGGCAALFLLNTQVHTIQAAVSAKDAQVGTSEQIARRCQQTEATYTATLARTQYLESSVSTQAYVPTLLQQLQTLATATHLSVTAVRPGPITAPAPPHPAASAATGDAPASADAATVHRAPPPPYDTMDIAVDVTGTYADTVAFLYGLTRFPKIVSVTGAQLHPNSGASGGPSAPVAAAGATPIVTTNLHLTAFVFHDDSTHATSAPAPSAPPVGAAIRQANGTRAEVGVGTL